jgi:hypothetical protein
MGPLLALPALLEGGEALLGGVEAFGGAAGAASEGGAAGGGFLGQLEAAITSPEHMITSLISDFSDNGSDNDQSTVEI